MSSTTLKRTSFLTQTLLMMFGVLLAGASFATPIRAQGFQVGLGVPRHGTPDRFPPVFRVRAIKDKKVYDTVEDTYKEIGYKIKVKGICPEKHHLSTSRISIANPKARQQIDFPVDKKHRNIGADYGREWAQYNFDFPFLLPKVSPIQACNAEVQRRVDAGQSLPAILQKGFTIEVDDAYDVSLGIGCEKTVHVGFYETPVFRAYGTLPATIECQATGYIETQGAPGKPGKHVEPAPPRMPTPPPPLESVSVIARPANTRGEGCPVYVNFKGKIEANPESKYTTLNTKYRFTGDNGYQTDWISVSVARDTPRTVNGRRFIQAPASKPGGTILAPGEKPKIPLYRGWTELEVQLPNGSKKSERADFTVDCNAAPARPRIKASNDNGTPQSKANVRGGTGKDRIFNSSNGSTVQQPDSGAPSDKKAALAQSDLSISQFLFPPTNDKALRVRVVNMGQGPSAACRLVLTVRKINGTAVGRTIHVNVPALAAGAADWLHIDAKSILPNNVSLQSTTFRLNVDATELVAESNESNNEVWHNQ